MPSINSEGNGWSEPPKNKLTIDAIREYREWMMSQPADDGPMVFAFRCRMPRSKKKRIRKKWLRNPKNWIPLSPQHSVWD